MLGLGPATVGYLNPEAKGDNIVRGVTFASAASGFYPGTAKIHVSKSWAFIFLGNLFDWKLFRFIFFVQNVLNLDDQLEMYKQCREDLAHVVGAANASTILSDSMYLISTGSNDYLKNYYFNLIL